MNRPSLLVAAGILLSRVAGFVRLRVFAYYFGLESDAADAFNAGFRIPNFLQNLFGEGALSASFIPVYAGLAGRGERREADRVAGAVASLLGLMVAVLVLAGVLATPVLIAVIAPGFTGAKRELTIQIVRILFPGAGFLVLSAWCLGVLNSHHKFLLSYAAPVMWNAAMIGTLIIYGRSSLPDLAVMLAWGSVAGSALQLAVQLPAVFRLAPDVRFAFDTASGHIRTVARNFVPVFISRGVVQISAYIDAMIASLLPTGAVTGLSNAQLLYTLPSTIAGTGAASAAALRQRLDSGLRQIAFFVIPSAMAFLALGDVIASALLQTGRFRHSDAIYVWGILAGSAIGLLASTLGRLYSSAFYALRDTRTPLRYAVLRVALTTVLGYLSAVPLPKALGIPLIWGTAGLTASAGIAGWVEMLLLRRALNAHIGTTGLAADYSLKLWTAAILGAAAGWIVKTGLPEWHPALTAVLVLGTYGMAFVAATFALGIPEARSTMHRLRGKTGV